MAFVKDAYDPLPIICEANWEGFILHEMQGEYGFGYDPIFFVPTHHCSAAHLPLKIKTQISHRAQALQQLKATLS